MRKAFVGVILFFALIPTIAAPLYTKKNFKCLADNLHHEARGEGFLGMVAVANVVLNRAKNSKYPGKICDVVYQRGQFSWTLVKNKNYSPAKYSPEVTTITTMALQGELRDVTSGATHYYSAHAKKPLWVKSMKKTVTVNNHKFYK